MSPYAGFHSCRMKDPGQFTKFRYKKQAGSDVIMGMTKDGMWEVQAIRYPKESIAEAEARASCGRHGGSFEAASGAKDHSDELTFLGKPMEEWPSTEDFPKDITKFFIELGFEQRELFQNKKYAQKLIGVEVFKSGVWNGDKYSNSDLDEMVSAFHTLNQRVPLKLGHDESQKFWGQKDGSPALGWVHNPRRVNDTLLADFDDVPDDLVGLIKNKRYRTVSAEIYWNYKNPEGRTFPRALRAVSLLGADLPAVPTLKDLQTALMSDNSRKEYPHNVAGDHVPETNVWRYSNGTTEIRWYAYDTHKGGDPMDAEKEKKFTDSINVLEGKVKTLTDDLKAQTTKTEAAEARAVRAEAALASKDEENAIVQFTSKLEVLVKDGKVLPAEKDGLTRTYVALGSGKKKYGDKEFDPREEFVKSLEARQKVVSFKQSGKGDDTEEETNPSVAINEKVQKVMDTDKKLSYTEALQVVKKAEPDLWNAYMGTGKGGK